jgi:hypothetical protein
MAINKILPIEILLFMTVYLFSPPNYQSLSCAPSLHHHPKKKNTDLTPSLQQVTFLHSLKHPLREVSLQEGSKRHLNATTQGFPLPLSLGLDVARVRAKGKYDLKGRFTHYLRIRVENDRDDSVHRGVEMVMRGIFGSRFKDEWQLIQISLMALLSMLNLDKAKLIAR